MIDDWKTDDAGAVTVHPLTAFETLIAEETSVALRLSYLNEPGSMELSSTLQLILSPQKAVELAFSLLNAAGSMGAALPPGLVS